MNTSKLAAGDQFPQITVKTLDDQTVTLGQPAEGTDWQMIIVYRGKHCPLCTKYLNQIESFKQRLFENKVDLVAVSADSKEQLQEHLSRKPKRKRNLDVADPISDILYHAISISTFQ